MIAGTGKVDHNYATDTLRPQFGQATAADYLETIRPERRLQSDLQFDLFGEVLPGYGEGMDNKLFLGQHNRDKYIRYQEPMNLPGSYIGPINGTNVPPPQWQRVITDEDYNFTKMKFYQNLTKGAQLVMKMGPESTGILGYDRGYDYDYSSKALGRDRRSPFEPVINTNLTWQKVKPKTGIALNERDFCSDTFSYRQPRNNDAHQNQRGTKPQSRKRTLEHMLQ